MSYVEVTTDEFEQQVSECLDIPAEIELGPSNDSWR